MARFCTSCGRQLEYYDRFCDRCGAVQHPEPPQQIQYMPAPSQPPPIIWHPRQPPSTIQSPEAAAPRAPEPTVAAVTIQPARISVISRPLGVTLLAAYYIVCGIGGIIGVAFTVLVAESLRQTSLSVSGLPVPDVTYLSITGVLSALVTFAIAYGLLKGKPWARVILRILSALSIAVVLLSMGLVIVFMSPVLFAAGAFAPAMSSFIATVYGIMVASALVGIALPVAIFWYLGRAHVRAYFAREKSKTAERVQSPSAE